MLTLRIPSLGAVKRYHTGRLRLPFPHAGTGASGSDTALSVVTVSEKSEGGSTAAEVQEAAEGGGGGDTQPQAAKHSAAATPTQALVHASEQQVASFAQTQDAQLVSPHPGPPCA